MDGELVATSGLALFQRPPVAGNLSGLEGYIQNMYTLPHRGIATALLEKIVNFMKNAGGRRLWLDASPPGLRVYENAGFVPINAEAETSATLAMELVW